MKNLCLATIKSDIASTRYFFCTLPLVVVAVVAFGCSSRAGSRLAAPRISGDIAASFLKEFDKDGNGSIAATELPKGFTFGLFDTDQNGSITADELSAVIQQWQEMKVGLSSFSMQFMMNGKPLEGVTVTLEPYPFMGTGVLPASGVSDYDGKVEFSIDEASLPIAGVKLMHSGFYRMTVSKQSGGKETIPAKYNSESILGCAFLPTGRTDQILKL